MKHSGATDFVMKPFAAADPSLERVIEDALRAAHRDRVGAKSHSQLVGDPEPPQPFEQGEMVLARLCAQQFGHLGPQLLDLFRRSRQPDDVK